MNFPKFFFNHTFLHEFTTNFAFEECTTVSLTSWIETRTIWCLILCHKWRCWFPHTYQIQSVFKKICFYFQVKWAFKGKRWTEIDFEKPGIEVRVEQDIVAEQFVAIRSVHIWPAKLHFCRLFNANQTLYNHIIYLCPHQISINALLLKMLAECTQTPFIACVWLVGILIFNVVIILLVYWIIRQMRILAFFCHYVMIWILFSSKSNETFSINVNSKRIEAGYNHVEAKIKLISIEEKWIVNVARHNTSFVFVNFFQIASKVYASTTWRSRRFYYPDVVSQWSMSTWLNLTVTHEDLVAHFGVLAIIVVCE